jgi:hypothetical protein
MYAVVNLYTGELADGVGYIVGRVFVRWNVWGKNLNNLEQNSIFYDFLKIFNDFLMIL